MRQAPIPKGDRGLGLVSKLSTSPSIQKFFAFYTHPLQGIPRDTTLGTPFLPETDAGKLLTQPFTRPQVPG